MKGDFSRLSYHYLNNYLGVLKQQGRVELDSDWNEQSLIWSEHFRQLACSIMGDFAVPKGSNEITSDNSKALKIENFSLGPGDTIDFEIKKGIVYIGGFPLKIEKDCTFRTQFDYPEPEIIGNSGNILVYLEAWQKTANYIDDDIIREPALGGPDTCLRLKLVGQIKALYVDEIANPKAAKEFLDHYFPRNDISLTLKIDQSGHQIPISFGEIDMGGGLIPGNLHYRIELHRGVSAAGGFEEGFKWSDENASVVARIIKAIDQSTLSVEESEVISGESFKNGDWIEIANAVTELHRQGSQMAKIAGLEHSNEGLVIKTDTPIHPILIRLKSGVKSSGKIDFAPRIRRWAGYISPLNLKTVNDLGGGVKAIFNSSSKKMSIEPGDYWTYAVRDREYNKHYSLNNSVPTGIIKYRCPLAIINNIQKKHEAAITDCRKFIRPLNESEAD